MSTRQNQPATGREIKSFRVTCDFNDHRAKTGASQCIARCTQGILGLGHRQKHDVGRIKAKLKKARGTWHSMFLPNKFFSNPQHLPVLGKARRKTNSKTRRRYLMASTCKHFMECVAA